MYNYPVEFDEFTEDDLERQELRASYIDPSSYSDEFSREVERLSTQLATLSRSLPQKQRRAAELYFRGKSRKEIADETGANYQTVCNALHNPKSLQVLQLLTQLNELKGGPSLEARRAMLWRIATRAEHKAPGIAMKAIDTLEKQAGTYRPLQDEHIDTGLVVETAIFNVQNNVYTLAPTRDAPIIEHDAPDFAQVIVDVE